MEYLKATVITTSEFSDIASLCFIELGSEGVSVQDFNDIRDVLEKHNWDYADETLLNGDDGRVFVSGFFPTNFALAKIESAFQQLKKNSEISTGCLEISVRPILSEEWENEWRKFYSPIVIRNVVIVPKWIQRENDGKTEVRLDPGMAFGTGSHETTALCIDLMQDYDLLNKAGADVGCGSGILGIAALKLGAKKCTFIDIDPLAAKATAENCELNGVTKQAHICLSNLANMVDKPLDFVFANITADILKLLLNDISTALKSKGRLVISGLIHSRAEEVLAAYSEYFTLLSRKKDGEWQAMSFEKKV